MATPSSTMLTEAIAAARAGERSRARDLISRLLRTDSSNAEYWIWMSSVVETKREKIYCLESAIRLDPTNRAAMRGLTILGVREPEKAELAAAIRVPRRNVVVVPKTTPVERSLEVPWKKLGTGAVGLFIVAGVVGLAVLLAPLIRSFLGTRVYRPASTLPTVSPTITASPEPGTPTVTPIPAATRVMRTPISSELAKTPLAFLIPATATPTPIIGITPHAFEAYDLGISALSRGDYELALEMMEQVVDSDPDLPDAHYFMGEALRLMGEIAEAIKAYDQAVNTDADYAPAYLGRGRALLERNVDAAIDDFNRALRRDPLMIEAYLEMGSYYTSSKLWLKMESTMSSALERGLTTPMLRIYLSEAQLNLGDFTSALENALEGSADDAGLLPGYLAVGRAYVAVGIASFDPDHFTSSLWPLQTYLAYQPEDHIGWATLGRAQVHLGDIDQAFTSLEIAIELNDRYAPAYLARGILNIKLDDYEAAIEDLKMARRYSTPTYDFYLTRGRVLYLVGEYVDALEDLNAAVEAAQDEAIAANRDKKLAEAYALRALVYETNEDLLNDAILNWRWVLGFANAIPETRALAQEHLEELTGKASTQTPTSSPMATITVTETITTPSATPTRTPSPTP